MEGHSQPGQNDELMRQMSKTKTVWALQIDKEITDVSLNTLRLVSGKVNCSMHREAIYLGSATHCRVYPLTRKLK